MNDAHVIDASSDNSYEVLVRTVLDELNKQTTKSIQRAHGVKTETKFDPSTNKTQGIFFGIIGILCIIIAWISGMAAEGYKPLEIRTGYAIYGSNGTIYQSPVQQSGTIGGNSEAVEYYTQMQSFLVLLGVAFIVMAIIHYAKGKKFDNEPSVTKYGQVITKDLLGVVIQFYDGSRERLQYNNQNIILREGDKGNFEIKRKIIISFERNR